MKTYQFLTFLLLMLGFSNIIKSEIIYVKQNAIGANNGTSWEDAFTLLQDALTAATSGTEIWVASGTYLPSTTGDRTEFFEPQNGVSLYGGFDGTESSFGQRDWTTNLTILSGDLNGDDEVVVSNDPTTINILNNGENSYHVLRAPNKTGVLSIDGFIIQNGNANNVNSPNNTGGGFVFSVSEEAPTLRVNIRNTIFKNNSAREFGGAIRGTTGVDRTYVLSLNRVDFIQNTVTGAGLCKGGAICNISLGNAIVNATYCRFIQNTSDQRGGAICNDGAVRSTHDNCLFDRNYGKDGGALFENISNLLDLHNCTFFGNEAWDNGGAIVRLGNFGEETVRIYNTIFQNNQGTNNNTISTINYDMDQDFIIRNCLFDEAVSDIFISTLESVDNVFEADALFNNPFNGGFSLQEGSPAINQGDNEYVLSVLDITGASRIQGGTVDIGAFEFEEPDVFNSVQVALKCYLQGGYKSSLGQMNNDLQSDNLLPNIHPFTQAPYNYNDELDSIDINALDFEVVDYVLVEARSGNLGTNESATEWVESKVGLLKTDGNIVNFDNQPLVFENLVAEENYHFVIRQQSHLDVISQAAIEISESIFYDFSLNVEQAAGSEQQALSEDGKAMLLVGDYTQDGVIQVTDLDAWEMNPAQINVYSPLDGTLDGVVQLTDADAWLLNKAKLGHVEVQY